MNVDDQASENANQAGQTAVQDDPDERSVFVRNVDFSADDAQLTEHFKECGEIIRVTIKKDPQTARWSGAAPARCRRCISV